MLKENENIKIDLENYKIKHKELIIENKNLELSNINNNRIIQQIKIDIIEKEKENQFKNESIKNLNIELENFRYKIDVCNSN